MPTINGNEAGQVLGAADSAVSFLLTRLGQAAERRARGVLAAHDLKPRQMRVLDLLGDRGPIGQRELGELMAVDHSILVHLLNPMERDGLVVRARDAADRRRHVVTLTPAGMQRLHEAGSAFEAVETALLEPLEPEQREQLRALLLALQQAHLGGATAPCGTAPESSGDCSGD